MSELPLPRTLRTADQPMAFTPDEMLRGALIAWGTFLALLAAGFVVLGLASSLSSGRLDPGAVGPFIMLMLFALFLAAIASGVVMSFGLLLIRAIASSLRTVRSFAAHLAVYSFLGILIGFLYLAVVTSGHPFEVMTFLPGSALVAYPALAAAVALPFGWWWTARRALRDDFRTSETRRERRDPDAVVEDGAAT